jgi:hypothetical protein
MIGGLRLTLGTTCPKKECPFRQPYLEHATPRMPCRTRRVYHDFPRGVAYTGSSPGVGFVWVCSSNVPLFLVAYKHRLDFFLPSLLPLNRSPSRHY